MTPAASRQDVLPRGSLSSCRRHTRRPVGEARATLPAAPRPSALGALVAAWDFASPSPRPWSASSHLPTAVVSRSCRGVCVAPAPGSLCLWGGFQMASQGSVVQQVCSFTPHVLP